MKAIAKGERSYGIHGIFHRIRFAGDFGNQGVTVMTQPGFEGVIGIFSSISEKQRNVIGYSFRDPLVSIAVPGNLVPPPLVSQLMVGNNFGELFLAIRIEAQAALSFTGEERKFRQIKQSGPALACGTRDLRHLQSLIRKWPAKSAEILRGLGNFTSELVENGGWIGGRIGFRCGANENRLHVALEISARKRSGYHMPAGMPLDRKLKLRTGE